MVEWIINKICVVGGWIPRTLHLKCSQFQSVLYDCKDNKIKSYNISSFVIGTYLVVHYMVESYPIFVIGTQSWKLGEICHFFLIGPNSKWLCNGIGLDLAYKGPILVNDISLIPLYESIFSVATYHIISVILWIWFSKVDNQRTPNMFFYK
jgi:hypothetical protein